jgi:predicted  nucleic acid-binding Zn-ribbon protein
MVNDYRYGGTAKKMDEQMATINYRLTNIEQNLNEIKDVVMESKMHTRDIEGLKNRETELLNAINAHDKRLRALEIAPTQEKAGRWTTIADNVFKTLIAVLLAMVLAKIGLTA